MTETLAILNTSIVTAPGDYEVRSVTLDEARRLVAEAPAVLSAVGHDATAAVLTEMLGRPVQVNRIQFEQQPGQQALVLKLRGRIPEGQVLDVAGMDAIGYTSDQQRTSVDFGWDDPACPREPSIPDGYGDGVVTPHASFLALDFDRDAALANLDKLRRDFDVYGRYGFYDAVDVGTGQVSRFYLALDQGMIMAALGNELRNDQLQRYAVGSDLRRSVRPLLRMEHFTAGRAGS